MGRLPWGGRRKPGRVSRFSSRSRSAFQDAIPSFKIQVKIQFRVSRCNSKFQDSNQDPDQFFKMQSQVSRFSSRSSRSAFQDAIPSFKIQVKIQFRVSRCNSKFQDSNQDPDWFFKIHTNIQLHDSRCSSTISRFILRSSSACQDA